MKIMDMFKNTIKQIRSLGLVLIGIYVPIVLLFLGVEGLTKIIPNLSIQDMLRDVAAIGEIPFYSGAISQLGLLLWSAATTLCLITFFTLRKIDSSKKESLNFLFFAGALSGYLMLDDTFMLHEEFLPNYLKIIPEKAVILLLGLAMLSFLYFNRNEILKSEYSLILLTYIFFGLSATLDAIPARFYKDIYLLGNIEYFLEDGAKFTSIVTWVTFFARYCYQQLSLRAYPHFQETSLKYQEG